MHAHLIILIAGFVVLGGCASAAERKTAEEVQNKKQVAREIDRICHLPKEERDARLEKLQKETGLVLYCGGGDTEK